MSSSTAIDLIAEGIDKLAAEDLDGIAAGCLGEDLVELARESARLNAEVMRRGLRWDNGKGWSIDGSRCGASWLAKQCGWSQGEAKAKLVLARQLPELPAVEAALASGKLSETKAKVIARETHAAAEHLPEGDDRTAGELFEPCAESIIAYAKVASVRELAHVMAAFRDSLDPDGGLGEWNRKMALRRLSASRTLDGMVRGDMLLDPECGETFLGTLGQLEHLLYEQDQLDPTSTRTPEQRRVDALGLMASLARGALDDLPGATDSDADDPKAAALRMCRQRGWDATVTVDIDKVRGGCAHPGHYGSGEPITTATAQRLLCDAAIRFVLVGEGHPLYLGRKKRLATLEQIVGLITRDGTTCAIPDCPLDVRFCQAHHVEEWNDFGPTDIDNLVLLCHRHHQMVHEGRWRIEMRDGFPHFFRPDGTLIEPRPPPPTLAAA
jgi:hypothetical protein